MKKSENIGHKLMPFAFLALLVWIWDFVTANGYVEKYILPSPRDVVQTFFEIFEELIPHIMVTMQEAIIGLLLAVVIAVLLALMMDYFKFIKLALYPILVVSQTVPVIVLAPLFAIWFGFGMLPKIIVVTLVCFFPIVVSLVEGFEAIDKDQVNLLKSMGASKLSIFRNVKFPGALVSFFSGLKVAATYCVMGAFIGEWMGGTLGLGLYMLRAKKSFQLEKVFVVIFIVIILSLLVFQVVSLIQYLSMPWERKNQENQ